MKTGPATETRRMGAAACLLAAPLLMLAGDALRYWAGAQRAGFVMVKLSFALFVGAALAVVRMTSQRADRVGLLGGALAVVGCLSGASIVTANAVLRSIDAAGLGESATRAVEEAFKAGGVGEFVFLYPLPGLAFPAGFVVLAYALRRARAASKSAAAALAVGALLFPVGRIGGLEWAVLGSGVGMSVGLGLTALRVLGMRAGEWARARVVAETDAPLGGQTAAG
ncbi:MAG TPA: hypothetical protein VF588_05145 [Pyrinomonadaceae bacterium]|jgi:hypothetical protein